MLIREHWYEVLPSDTFPLSRHFTPSLMSPSVIPAFPFYPEYHQGLHLHGLFLPAPAIPVFLKRYIKIFYLRKSLNNIFGQGKLIF